MLWRLRRWFDRPPIGPADRDDFDRFYALCMVCPQGPWAQEYLMTLNPEVVSKAACEVRKAIEKSMYAEYQFGQDQILLLLRVEMTPTHLAAQLARETDPALLISESPLKPE